jgi:hypothetical protein
MGNYLKLWEEGRITSTDGLDIKITDDALSSTH